jgi:beta-glucanase (GH16 family)
VDRRRLLVLVFAISALAAISALGVSTFLGTQASDASARTWQDQQYVAATGNYEVVVRLGGAGRSQRVEVFVAHAPPRTVLVRGQGHTSLYFPTAIRRGPLVVRAVGSHFKPQIRVALSDPTTGGPAGPQPYTRLVWSDEFNGPAGTAPSGSRWIHDVGAFGSTDKELQTYTSSPANASWDGHGHLAIVARNQTATGPDGVTRGYTSARIETQGRFSATYGLIEARMKIPAGPGLWSSFWMLGNNFDTVGWPVCGEIDVMEALGQDPFTVRATIHGPIGRSSYSHGQNFLSATSLASRFHTYGVSWSPNSITWLIDGVAYASMTPADLAPGQTWAFNQPFHLVLNLAVGGDWPGPPNSFTSFPAILLVDWVRVYR